MDPAKLVAFADLFHKHARTCKKEREACKTCRCAAKFFEELPPAELNLALRDRGRSLRSMEREPKLRVEARA